MAGENSIHVRIDYKESLNSKKNLLSSEMSLLKVERNMDNYKSFRARELDLKTILNKKLKEASTNIRKLEKLLPKSKLPKEVEKQSNKDPNSQKTNVHKVRPARNIEGQLMDIQKRLDDLQRKGLEI